MKAATCIRIVLAVAGIGCFASTAVAQAPVSDVSTPRQRVEVNEGYGGNTGQNTGSRTYGAESSGSVSGSNASGNNVSGNSVSDNGSMFRQFQQLQEEVAALRGQLEEQSYELQKLKQQHQEDFANLDRRVSGAPALSNTTPDTEKNNGAISAQMPASSTGMATNAGSNTTANDDGKEEYERAYGLLKAKDYSGASTAFKTFVGKYPDSDYAGNSWFWLGFVYQTQGDMDAAGQAFSSLIERFPAHSKVDDAKYNLGKIYHQQGKIEPARGLLKEVAAGSSKSAPLAKSYLETM